MTKRIRNTGPRERIIRDTGPAEPRIDPDQVAAALGAELPGLKVEAALSPLSLLMVREELARRLQSAGGRPALDGVSRRPKIPLNDAEWSELEDLAAAIASPGFTPTAGQVASVLLTLSLRRVRSQAGKRKGKSSTRLANK